MGGVVNTLTYTGELTIEACPTCGTWHGIPTTLREAAIKDHSKLIWCPLGHSWWFIGETEAQKLTRSLKWERDLRASVTADRDQARASLRATKGVVTKLRKRTAEGECPFCGQHLRDLERHVNRQHVNEAADALAETDA